MISVEEALERVLSFIEALEPEEKPILECLGQVLAEDVYAGVDIPPIANSAMDGFAVKAEDTCGASRSSPRVLTVVDEVAAGALPHGEVEMGTAIRIMTGAPLPGGADAVVQFEDTDEVARKSSGDTSSQIGILCPVDRGVNIRLKGEDVRKGALILRKGTVLRPQEIGRLASLGRNLASVVRRPTISIIATGNELVDIGQPLSAGMIYNSNTYTVAAEVIRYGGIPKILGIGRDSVKSLNDKIDESLTSDMLITSGGVSVGDYDVVKDVLKKRGEIALWTVCMKPGKPLAFGVVNSRGKKLPHLGLPGNPVSAMVTFEQFARPAILKMLGRKVLAKPMIEATIDEDVKNSDGRRIYARVVVSRVRGEYHACLTGSQGSGILDSMAKSNGLAIIPENTAGVKAGDTVKIQMLDWNEDPLMEE